VALTKFNFNSFDLTTAASKGLAFNSSANGFETADEGSMTLIKTLTASSSSTLTFVNGSDSVVLDNTYPIYLFKFINIHPGTSNADLGILASTDTGSSYGVATTSTFFEAKHAEDDSQAELTYITAFDAAQSTSLIKLTGSIASDNDSNAVGEMYLFNPSSTTFVKHFISTANRMFNSRSLNSFVAGYVNTTSAVDAIQFKMDSGNIDSGTIKLYGIKDS
tara:strand:+ start:579 stop:1238 length:660 start_codon:yes stop_codon:yes gene_type:complete